MHKKQHRSTIYLSLLIAFFFLNAIHISDVGPEKNTHETYNSQFTNRLKGDSLVKGLKPSRTDRCHSLPI